MADENSVMPSQVKKHDHAEEVLDTPSELEGGFHCGAWLWDDERDASKKEQTEKEAKEKPAS